MSTPLDSTTEEYVPPFWYGIPHGYLRVDLYPSEEGLAEVVRQIRELPEEARERAEKVLRLYGGVVGMMQTQKVLGCAVGMHPDDQGEPSMSVLTVSSVPMTGDDPLRVLTRMMAEGVDGTEEFQPVELPAGVGFVTEQVRRSPSPRASEDAEPTSEKIWQGVVAIPDKSTSSVVTVQLATPSVHLSEEYRGVLLGVAHTVSFTDPNAPEPAEGDGGAGPTADAVRDVFG